MAKRVFRILSSICIAAFIFYLKSINIFWDKRFWIIGAMFLAFGLISFIEGTYLGRENE